MSGKHTVETSGPLVGRSAFLRDSYLAATLAVVVLAWLTLYGPVYYDLSVNVWWREEQSYGPVILAAAVWLLWKDRLDLFASAGEPSPAWGTVWCTLAALGYTLGRALDIYLLEVGSQIPMLLGLLLIFGGRPLARKAWLLAVLLVFMVPLPADLVSAVTAPLKRAVSHVATELLYLFNYPIAQTGVIIDVGPYQLLVADACSGLTSMFTLEALGLVYMKLMGYQSKLRNALIAILLIPISFVSNVGRVIILILITFHFGDAAGQGFMHGFAGLVLFVIATVLMIVVDNILGFFLGRRKSDGPVHQISQLSEVK